MWPRIVEVLLGCWLAVSPFIFRHSPENRVLWFNDLLSAAVVILLALVSFWPPLRFAHVANLAVALWLIGFGFWAFPHPTPPALQNNVVIGLLLLMFAIIPNEANRPPRTWRKFLIVGFFSGACVLAGARCDFPYSTNTRNQPAPSSTLQPTTTSDVYDFASVDNLLARIARKHGGCALVIVKDEKVIYRKGFGSHGPDRVIPIASASKWLAGALIMNLVDEGKLSLDDRVSRYLPEFTDSKSDITIRQLFAHTSGLPPEAGCRNNKRTTLEHCVNEITRMKLRAAPGEEFYYGGVSMQVGGRIAEIVSGKSWNDLFVERIAAPLGMSHSDFFAYGPTGNPRPAGDARSSADEYARFLQMILQRGSSNGKRILSEASALELHKDQTGGARIAYTIYEKHAALDDSLPLARYGVGVWREKTDASGQLLEASSQGALGFSPWIDFERNLGGVLSVRGSFSQALPDYLAVKDLIRGTVMP